MKNLFLIILYFVLFFGAGYFLLKFFSRLTGVDMFNAMKWGFKAKRFELVLTSIMFYLIAYVMFFAIITGPIFTITASATGIGGLQGYKVTDSTYKYYNPEQGKYVEIKHYNAPPAAEKLDEVFSIVSFYKPLTADYYDNVSNMSLPVSLIKIFIFLVGAIPLYLGLHALANEFNKSNKVYQEITHKFLFRNFSEVTGMSVSSVIRIIIIVVMIIVLAEFFISRNIKREHKNSLLEYSKEYRRRITEKVKPNDKIAGRIIRGEKTTIKRYINNDNLGGNLKKGDTKYYPAKIYIVAFSDILSIPVYLNLQLVGDADSNPLIRELDLSFTDKGEKEFIVNRDYSISLSKADY